MCSIAQTSSAILSAYLCFLPKILRLFSIVYHRQCDVFCYTFMISDYVENKYALMVLFCFLELEVLIVAELEILIPLFKHFIFSKND